MDIPHDAFSELRIPTNDWRAVFPPSLRVRNVVLIADALERRPYLKFEDPLALLEADKAERAFYVTSLGDFDYCIRIDTCIRRIRNVRQDLEDEDPDSKSDVRPPKLTNFYMPVSYFMMWPCSKEHIIERYLKPAPNSPGWRTHLIVLDREQSRKVDCRGPLESLTLRHGEVSFCVEQLLLMFRRKLDTYQLPHSSVNSACRELSIALMDLTNVLQTLRIQPEDQDLPIRYLEEKYVKLIRQAFTTFIRSVNIKPDCNQSKSEKDMKYRQLFMTRHGLAYQLPRMCDIADAALLDLASVLGDSHNSPEAQQQAQPGLLFDFHVPEQQQQSGPIEHQPMPISDEDMKDILEFIYSNGDQ